MLLVNLGTPDAPTPAAIRRYLAQFLSDRRVVELTPLLWLPILYGLILPFRPLWLNARAGTLQVGDAAPDFDLPTLDRSHRGGIVSLVPVVVRSTAV